MEKLFLQQNLSGCEKKRENKMPQKPQVTLL